MSILQTYYHFKLDFPKVAKRKDHPREKTMESARDGAVLDFTQILAYLYNLVHNMSKSQLHLGFGHFGWLPYFFGQ